MIDGRQIRAARAMLGWSREELLQAAGISMSALLRMEGGLSERFQPRRIAPEDVPPGMRVVRTPFGDRLVEQ